MSVAPVYSSDCTLLFVYTLECLDSALFLRSFRLALSSAMRAAHLRHRPSDLLSRDKTA